MHTIELDDDSFQNLVENATKEGKSPSQWLQEMIARYTPTPSSSNALLDFAELEILEEIKNPRPITELIGAGKSGFKNAAEVDAYIRAERDDWGDEVVYRNYKGELITAENQKLPNLAAFRAKFPKQEMSAGEFCRQMRDEDRY